MADSTPFPFEGLFKPYSLSAVAMPLLWTDVLPDVPDLCERINAASADESQQGWQILLRMLWFRLDKLHPTAARAYPEGARDYRWVEATCLVLGGWYASSGMR